MIIVRVLVSLFLNIKFVLCCMHFAKHYLYTKIYSELFNNSNNKFRLSLSPLCSRFRALILFYNILLYIFLFEAIFIVCHFKACLQFKTIKYNLVHSSFYCFPSSIGQCVHPVIHTKTSKVRAIILWRVSPFVWEVPRSYRCILSITIFWCWTTFDMCILNPYPIAGYFLFLLL